MAELRVVRSEDVLSVWFKLAPILNRAIDRSDGKYSESSVLKSIQNEEMQLWVAVEKEPIACCVTQLSNYPNKFVCTVLFCAGEDMNSWLHFIDEIEKWASSKGCQSLEIFGRPGWEKVLGWERIHVVLRKNL